MKERHTISWDCFTSFSFLTPISLINLLLQQWVKEIVSVGFFSCRIEWQRSWQCVPCLLPGLGLRLDTAQCGPKRTKTAPRNSPHALQPRVRQSAVPEPEAVPRTIWVCKTQALGGAGRAPGMPSGLGAPPPLPSRRMEERRTPQLRRHNAHGRPRRRMPALLGPVLQIPHLLLCGVQSGFPLKEIRGN